MKDLHGKCECGCGGIPGIARKTVTRLSRFKGQPVRFINGHQNHLGFFKKGVAPWNKGLRKTFDPRVASHRLGKKYPQISGPNHYLWISDRSKLKKLGDTEKDRRSSACVIWRNEVRKRDNFKCKMKNSDCEGRLETHHILSWTHFPELRYDLNNGITLCHAHHPRARAEEKRLIPEFQKLVAQTKEIL